MKNINTLDRTLRMALSLGLVLIALNMSGPIGTLAYAVFVSIYAGITAAIGWDPMIAAMSNSDKQSVGKRHTSHGNLIAH